MSETVNTTLAEPRFEVAPPMLLAGMGRDFTWDEMGEIPLLWQTFGQRIGSIPGQIGAVAYGVNHAPANDDPGCFGYIAAVEVADATALPDDLTTFPVPGQRYAVFAHRGHVTQLTDLVQVVMSEWLPQSGYRIPLNGPAGLAFLERYAEDFNPATGYGGMEVWLPIERD